MRFRAYIYIVGMCLLPSFVYSMAVTDLPGTSQAATEAGNTLNNWKESVTQTAAIQKTVSAIGTAQKGLTNALNAVTEFQQTVTNYQQQVQQAVNDVKEAANTVKNADKIAKGLADRAVNSVKSTAMSTVNSMKDTAMSTVNVAKSTANSVKDQATGMVDTGKGIAGVQNQGESSSQGAAAQKAGQSDETNNQETLGGVAASAAKASASDIVDAPAAAPTRRAIAGSVSSVASSAQRNVSSGAVSASRSVSAGGAARHGGAGGGSMSAASMAGATAAIPTDVRANNAAIQSAAPKQAVTQAAAKVLQAQPVSEADSLRNMAQQPAAASERVNADTVQNMSQQSVKAIESSVTGKADKLSVAKELKQADIKAVSNERAVRSISGETETVKKLENKAIAEQPAEIVTDRLSAVKSLKESQLQQLDKADIKPDQLNEKVLKDVSAVKSQRLKSAVKKINKQDLRSVEPQEDDKKTLRPARASFKTSAGYGRIHNSIPLAFASLGVKGGNAMGNIMVVPRDIFIRCMLDHEQAAEKDKMDECLKKINDLRFSEVTEETTKAMIDDADMDFQNGYADMLAAGFFEAMEIYNDSVDFYYQQIHPNQEVNNQRVADIAGAWTMTKDMNGLLNGRLNALNKILGRQLLLKGIDCYRTMSIQTPKEKKEISGVNTNMYGKVVVSKVLMDRCSGVSALNPEISEDCLKILAEDLASNAQDTDYKDWNEERGMIINEYASAYTQLAAQSLAKVGEDQGKVLELMGVDPNSTPDLGEQDVLKKITDNNAVANEVAAKFLNALDLRASEIVLDNVTRMLIEMVPSIKTDGGNG